MDYDKKKRIPASVYMFLTITATIFTIASFEHYLDARVSTIIGAMSGRSMLHRSKPQIRNSPAGFVSRSRTNRTFHIVVHMPTHGMLKRDPTMVKFSECTMKNCKVTVSQNTSGADSIIIQGSRPRQPLPRRINDKQIIIFASTETPLYLSYANLSDPFWNTYYNWSMTYRKDSDIPYMYGFIYPKYLSKQTVLKQLQTDNFFQERNYLDYEDEIYKHSTGIENKDYSGIYREKNVTAAWLVSHCNTPSRREDYIQNMTGTIDIDIFGKCSKRNCPKGTGCDDRVVKNTFFYLAFENSLCTDYITEKSFKWFEKDIVIVTRGARDYSVHLPKGTYVDADDFSSPTELAYFLKRLSSSENEYVEYLKRKDMYRVFQRGEMAKVAFCNLCRKLNSIDIYGKTFDMQKSWTNDSCLARNQLKVDP